MVTAAQFSLASVQGAIFTPVSTQFSQSNTLATILGKYAALYDGEVQALPAIDEMPPEFPRVTLESKNQVVKFQAGPTRIDSFWEAKAGAEPGNPFICLEVLEDYVRSTKAPLQVGRVALVIKRLAFMDNPAGELIERFCNAETRERLFNNSKAFELHNHKRYELSAIGVGVNSWVRCKTGAIKQEPDRKVIILEQDINTLAENAGTTDFDADRINAFFAAAKLEADDILRIYFPSES